MLSLTPRPRPHLIPRSPYMLDVVVRNTAPGGNVEGRFRQPWIPKVPWTVEANRLVETLEGRRRRRLRVAGGTAFNFVPPHPTALDATGAASCCRRDPESGDRWLPQRAVRSSGPAELHATLTDHCLGFLRNDCGGIQLCPAVVPEKKKTLQELGACDAF